jgi:hypothetical protein
MAPRVLRVEVDHAAAMWGKPKLQIMLANELIQTRGGTFERLVADYLSDALTGLCKQTIQLAQRLLSTEPALVEGARSLACTHAFGSLEKLRIFRHVTVFRDRERIMLKVSADCRK